MVGWLFFLMRVQDFGFGPTRIRSKKVEGNGQKSTFGRSWSNWAKNVSFLAHRGGVHFSARKMIEKEFTFVNSAKTCPTWAGFGQILIASESGEIWPKTTRSGVAYPLGWILSRAGQIGYLRGEAVGAGPSPTGHL